MRPEDVGKREGSLTGEEMGGEKVKFALKKGARGSVGEVIKETCCFEDNGVEGGEVGVHDCCGVENSRQKDLVDAGTESLVGKRKVLRGPTCRKSKEGKKKVHGGVDGRDVERKSGGDFVVGLGRDFVAEVVEEGREVPVVELNGVGKGRGKVEGRDRGGKTAAQGHNEALGAEEDLAMVRPFVGDGKEGLEVGWRKRQKGNVVGEKENKEEMAGLKKGR